MKNVENVKIKILSIKKLTLNNFKLTRKYHTKYEITEVVLCEEIESNK